MNIDLQGKRALVCGASRGIGRACAIALAQHGAEIVAAARDTDRLEKLTRELPAGEDRQHLREAAHQQLQAGQALRERRGDAPDLAAVGAYVLTIEPEPDADPAPSHSHVLAGDFSGGTAALSVGHPAALGDDYTAATGPYILNAPSGGGTAGYEQGIWWLDPSGGSLALYDRPLDVEWFRRCMRRAVAEVPRLRQRVEPGLAPLSTPRWVHDHEFDLDWHVRHIGAPGSSRHLTIDRE